MFTTQKRTQKTRSGLNFMVPVAEFSRVRPEAKVIPATEAEGPYSSELREVPGLSLPGKGSTLGKECGPRGSGCLPGGLATWLGGLLGGYWASVLSQCFWSIWNASP